MIKMKTAIFFILLFLPPIAHSQETTTNPVLSDTTVVLNDTIDFSAMPLPPMPPEYSRQLQLIIDLNNISNDDFNKVIIIKDTNILGTSDISLLRGTRNLERGLHGNIDTVKNENKIYYYQISRFGSRDIVKAEKYNSQNLLVEAIMFGDDSVVSDKTFFDYNENGVLLSTTEYNFWVEAPDSILELKILYIYKNGRLTEKNTIRNLLHSSAKRISNIYYNKSEKIIKTEHSIVENNEILWKDINEYKYNKKNKLEMYIHNDLETLEKFTLDYIENRIVTYRKIKNKPKEKYYEYIFE